MEKFVLHLLTLVPSLRSHIFSSLVVWRLPLMNKLRSIREVLSLIRRSVAFLKDLIVNCGYVLNIIIIWSNCSGVWRIYWNYLRTLVCVHLYVYLRLILRFWSRRFLINQFSFTVLNGHITCCCSRGHIRLIIFFKRRFIFSLIG